MSENIHRHLFTSESVSDGHPDKVADQISDAILDACMLQDDGAHVACETMVGPQVVINMGEITCANFSKVDTEAIARQVVKDIGYTEYGENFDWKTLVYDSYIHGQSADIARGVNRKLKIKQGAGDQGMMFGYATNETKQYMPTSLVLAHELVHIFSRMRHRGRFKWMRPDAKSQVTMVYENGKPVRVDTVVVSQQTTEMGANQMSYDKIEGYARDFMSRTGLWDQDTKFIVNPTGKFVIGGPAGDCGLTGRKIIVDTYGGVAAHGGGAFSGKDPSKVDRSAAYYARYAAKNIVAAGLADRCQIQVAYAIGIDKPVSFCVKTFGTAKEGVTNELLEKMLISGKIFDFRPYALIEELQLTKPRGWCYRDTATYGHFGRDIFPWERLNKVADLQKYFGG